METHTNVLLVTANVGSLFDQVGDIEKYWLQEFSTVYKYNPRFIALHFQEVGGKNYRENMKHAELFFRTIENLPEMADFNRACVYIDSDYISDNFTALGSMYYIHNSLKNIQQYDFNVKEFKAITGYNKHVGSLEALTTLEKEKFSKNFWPDFKWSRKGYMRTRWLIDDQALDLVNIHLFHDASNIIAYNSSPSVYSLNRKRALKYVMSRISDSRDSHVPFFLFGDFNFRLDTLSLVQNLCLPDMHMVNKVKKKNSSSEVELITFKEIDHDHQILQIETKVFDYLDKALFSKNNVKELLKFDKEISAFSETITEEDIQFPPSYPYSEENTKPEEYMKTRCPAWCDRILMSQDMRDIIHRQENNESNVVYNTLGPKVCMGDHKPVFLCFTLKTIAY